MGARMGRLTNNFFLKDRCALPDQMPFVLTFTWRAFVFAMRNRDCTNLDEISVSAFGVTTKDDFPHEHALPVAFRCSSKIAQARNFATRLNERGFPDQRVTEDHLAI